MWWNTIAFPPLYSFALAAEKAKHAAQGIEAGTAATVKQGAMRSTKARSSL